MTVTEYQFKKENTVQILFDSRSHVIKSDKCFVPKIFESFPTNKLGLYRIDLIDTNDKSEYFFLIKEK